jgi:predicted AlkP superfamily phosphohydrolase/phosphomutase
MASPDMANGGAAKTVLIGLDGATYYILDQLIALGLMPNLDALMRRGARAVLKSTNHPLTPPAWTALMTGRTPGVHGIYDFVRVDREGDAPSYTLANSGDVHAETIWSIASRQGRRVTALNYPMMFPAPVLDGVVIPGYVPWSYLARAVRPREIYKRLKDAGAFNVREMSTDWELERKAVQGLAEDQLEEWVRVHIVRERHWFDILMILMREEPCDLTGVLFDGVDRLQHLCFHLIDPSTADQFTSPDARAARDLSLRYFQDIDDYVGEIVAKAGPASRIIVASDHGFIRASDTIFYVNTWLEQNGYLRWREGVAADEAGRVGLNESDELGRLFDWSGTTAFAFTSSSNGIYIRRANGHGGGGPGIADAEYAAFRDRLRDGLLSVRDPATGAKLIADVLTAEAAFPGPHSGKAPDLTLVLADFGFQSVLRSVTPVQRRRAPYGTHHPDGIFVVAGPGTRAGRLAETLSICDVAATVLYSLGLPIPQDMEGKVPVAAFDSAHVTANPVTFGDAAGGDAPVSVDEAASEDALPPEAEAEIRERLKALGYL